MKSVSLLEILHTFKYFDLLKNHYCSKHNSRVTIECNFIWDFYFYTNIYPAPPKLFLYQVKKTGPLPIRAHWSVQFLRWTVDLVCACTCSWLQVVVVSVSVLFHLTHTFNILVPYVFALVLLTLLAREYPLS